MAWSPKIVIYGADGSGKSSMVRRWMDGDFSNSESPTLGVNPRVYHDIQVWDTSGQERFRALALQSLEGACAVVFVYSIANYASFDDLKRFWIPKVHQALGIKAARFPKYMVGTKLDLEELDGRREVSVQDAVELAASHDLHYSEISAKTGHGMDHLVLFLEHQQRPGDKQLPALQEDASALDLGGTGTGAGSSEEQLQVLEAFPGGGGGGGGGGKAGCFTRLFTCLFCCCCRNRNRPGPGRTYLQLEK